MPFSWVAAGSAILGAVNSVSAGNTQSNANNNAANQQLAMYNQNNANLSPFLKAGQGATGTLQSSLAPGGSLNANFTPQDYLNNQDPGYQFQLNQGTSALQNSQAANSGALSGSALKGLMSYNQDYASTGYQNAFNRWQSNQSNTYSRLMGLAGLGENAGAQVGNNSVSFGQNIGSNIVGAGNAQAAGTVGAGNALSQGANNAAGYYYMNQMLGNGMSGGQWNQGNTTYDNSNGAFTPIGNGPNG